MGLAGTPKGQKGKGRFRRLRQRRSNRSDELGGGISLDILGYDAAELIGQGGFGTVYKARETSFDRIVAVKILSAPGLEAETRRRFELECQALGRLSGHPHVVTVYDSGFTETGRPYITMAYAPRGSLAQLIRGGRPLPWTQAVDITIKLAGAIETAHRASVLHRDIKPENVLFTLFDEPELADFGFANIRGGAQAGTAVVTASLHHVAPEVLRGERPSVASDIYSLASTAFTLLAGHPPFVSEPGDADYTIIARTLTESPPSLEPLGVPRAVCTALERALSKDPNARHPSAVEFGAELQRAQQQEGLVPTPMRVGTVPSVPVGQESDAVPPGEDTSSLTQRVHRQRDIQYESPAAEPARPRRRMLVAVSTAAVTVLLAAAVALAVGVGKDDPKRAVSLAVPARIAFTSTRDGNLEIYVMNADGKGQTNVTRNAATDAQPSWSPDGKRIAFMSERDKNHEIYVMNADGSGQVRITNHPASDSLAAWSPDGKRIAFTSKRDGNHEIYVMNADGSGQVRITNHPSHDFAPTWSPDSSRIAFTSNRAGPEATFVTNADGSGQVPLRDAASNETYPDWSRQGDRIVFAASPITDLTQTDVYIVNLDGKNLVRLTRASAPDSFPRWSPDGSRVVFQSERDGNLEIYTIRSDGTDEVRLTFGTESDSFPTWSQPTTPTHDATATVP